MVLSVEPISNCIDALKKKKKIDDIYITVPDGECFTQKMANKISIQKTIVILCGHYKGFDERVRKHIATKEISIGEYTLTGGELAASVICDAVVRLLPGVLGNEESALSDSFQDGIISHPVYTRPQNFKGWNVPEILLSGNKKEIEKWKSQEAEKRTEAFYTKKKKRR